MYKFLNDPVYVIYLQGMQFANFFQIYTLLQILKTLMTNSTNLFYLWQKTKRKMNTNTQTKGVL